MSGGLVDRWVRGWNVFWFALVDARSLGLMRITLGILVLVFHVGLWPDLEVFFTDDGPMDLRALAEGWTEHRWSYLDGLDGPELQVAHVLGLVVILAFTVGALTPLSAVLTLLVLISIWHRAPFIQNGGDRLLRIWVFYLALAPSGRALSVDAWWRNRGLAPSMALVPVYAHRLIMLQTMVMYAYTGIAKLQGNTWHKGTAIYYALSDLSFARVPQLFDRLMATQMAQLGATVGTLSTLVWEVGFIPLVLYKRTRWLALGLGLLFHGGIFFTMSVGIFSWASVWGYLAWLTPERLGALVERAGFAPRERG